MIKTMGLDFLILRMETKWNWNFIHLQKQQQTRTNDANEDDCFSIRKTLSETLKQHKHTTDKWLIFGMWLKLWEPIE